MFVVAKGTKAGKSQMKAMGTIKIVCKFWIAIRNVKNS
jgi:hypothetical protein